MGEHKYKDAYNKGYEKGKQDAFTGYCMSCYDELSRYEQVKLMVEWGADIPNVLDKIRAEIVTEGDRVVGEGEYFTGFHLGMICTLKIIDKYKAESEDKHGRY